MTKFNAQFNSWVRKICLRRDRLPTLVFLGSPCGSAGKESVCKWEIWVRHLGWGDPLEKGNTTHSSILVSIPGNFPGQNLTASLIKIVQIWNKEAATADPYFHRRHANTQSQVWLSLWGFSCCIQGFVWALWMSLVGMGFDSKCDFAPPTILLGLLLCPWMIRYLFKKIRDTKGTFHAKIHIIKDRNGMNLTEAENIKMKWQQYTEELYKIFMTRITMVMCSLA